MTLCQCSENQNLTTTIVTSPPSAIRFSLMRSLSRCETVDTVNHQTSPVRSTRVADVQNLLVQKSTYFSAKATQRQGSVCLACCAARSIHHSAMLWYVGTWGSCPLESNQVGENVKTSHRNMEPDRRRPSLELVQGPQKHFNREFHDSRICLSPCLLGTRRQHDVFRRVRLPCTPNILFYD